MSTNSSISIRKKDNTILSIYCHWDGGIKNVGNILFNYYNTYGDILELISRGNIESLGKTIDDCVFYSTFKYDLNIVHSTTFSYIRNYNYIFDNDKWFVVTDNEEWIPLEKYFLKETRLKKIKKLIE